ncbi:MAG TPA: DEAD/DEAH box helicase [Hyphomicrobiaceae bacterium]|nr:DEAD/DEAH box helicase [Hyphomicrobiaceae bacterium]
MTKFSELGLAAPILKALESAGYDTPTAIQAQAIPTILAGRDVLGIAQTGTGKTAAFALPILHRLAADRRPSQRRGCRVLVLSPTRELATQIGDSFRTYGRHLDLTVAVVLGGVSHRSQAQRMARGVDVLVATPGRLIDHVSEGNIVLAATEVLVLDEADQMLDLGFLPSIRRIVARLAAKRQSLFFSATMPREIGKLADELLRDPARVAVAPVAAVADRVDQRVIHVETGNKISLLVQLLGDPEMSRALVFTRTKRRADRVARHLQDASIGVAAIHGGKSQGQRERALDAFRAAKVRVLVATDIAARGIDIDHVTHVVNYELPDAPEAYVHRIGRTARAGAAGIAISLCDAEERGQLRDIERLTRQAIPAEDRRQPRGAPSPLQAEPRMHRGANPAPARNGSGPGAQGPGKQGSEKQGTGKPGSGKPGSGDSRHASGFRSNHSRRAAARRSNHAGTAHRAAAR